MFLVNENLNRVPMTEEIEEICIPQLEVCIVVSIFESEKYAPSFFIPMFFRYSDTECITIFLTISVILNFKFYCYSLKTMNYTLFRQESEIVYVATSHWGAGHPGVMPFPKE